MTKFQAFYENKPCKKNLYPDVTKIAYDMNRMLLLAYDFGREVGFPWLFLRPYGTSEQPLRLT